MLGFGQRHAGRCRGGDDCEGADGDEPCSQAHHLSCLSRATSDLRDVCDRHAAVVPYRSNIRAPANPIERTGEDGLTTENESFAFFIAGGPCSLATNHSRAEPCLNSIPAMRPRRVEPGKVLLSWPQFLAADVRLRATICFQYYYFRSVIGQSTMTSVWQSRDSRDSARR